MEVSEKSMTVRGKFRVMMEAAKVLGAFITVRWTPLKNEIDGHVRIKSSGRAQIEVNNRLGYEASLRAALHEVYHLKFRHLDRTRGLVDECIEAVQVLDAMAPGVLDLYEALAPPLQNVGEEAVVWLCEARAAGTHLPGASARLLAVLDQIISPRPLRLALTTAAPALFVAALVFGFSVVAAGATPAGIHRIAPGASAEIEAHGQCKEVHNAGSAPIMVPTRAAAEWSDGLAAFLAHVQTIPGVAVTDCRPALVAVGLAGCAGSGGPGGSYAGCRMQVMAKAGEAVRAIAFLNPAAAPYLSGSHDNVPDLVDVPADPAASPYRFSALQIQASVTAASDFCAKPGRLPGLYLFMFDGAASPNYDAMNIVGKWLTCQ